MIERNIGCLQTRDSDDARNAAGGQEVIQVKSVAETQDACVLRCLRILKLAKPRKHKQPSSCTKMFCS